MDISSTIQRYSELQLDKIPLAQGGRYFIGLDPASGSSNTSIVITNLIIVTDPKTDRNRDIIRVVYAQEYAKPSSSFLVNLCHDLRRRFNYNTKFLVDSSAPMLIRDFRSTLGEDPDYSIKDLSIQTDEVIPISF